MAQTPFAFTPSTGIRDTTAYPTVPASEAAARDQFQQGPDQLRDYINNTVNPAIDTINNSKGAVNGIATLGADGKVPSAQLPAATTINFYNNARARIG